MPIRSRMIAAVMVCAGTGLAAMASAPTPARGDEETVVNTVNLELRIAGLGREGCEIEVKPGHPACSFPAVRRRVESRVSGGIAKLPPISVVAESISADRDCSFAITIKEPGRDPRTFRRGIRLEPQAPGRATPIQSLTCYLSTPSLAAKDAPARPRR